MSAKQNSGQARLLYQAVNVSKGSVVVASKVEWAGSSEECRKGLLGRDSLDIDGGMYIVASEWVHTFRMRFPIDVAFLDARGRVLVIHHGLKPNRLSRIVFRADGALELAAGRLRETKTEVGDTIELRGPGSEH